MIGFLIVLALCIVGVVLLWMDEPVYPGTTSGGSTFRRD